MDQLEESRKSSSRLAPNATVDCGLDVLKRMSFRLGAEQWNVREQVFVAALDTNKLGVCESMLAELQAQFPDSQRVLRLKGLLLEAQGKNKEAAEVYDAMVKKNEINTVAMKRKICLLKSTGKLQDAIKQLVQYLDLYQADAEGWKELAKLYVEAGNFKSASFCLEEVILTAPHSYLSHLAYAESLYTVGSEVSNLLEARKYYCHSLTKKTPPSNGRALWGLLVTTKAIQGYVEGSGSTGKEKEGQPTVDVEVNKQLSMKAVQGIQKAKLPSGMDEIVAAALKRLSV